MGDFSCLFRKVLIRYSDFVHTWHLFTPKNATWHARKSALKKWRFWKTLEFATWHASAGHVSRRLATWHLVHSSDCHVSRLKATCR